METLIEENLKHGALPIHPIHRWVRRNITKAARASVPYDWKTYDVETVCGPLPRLDQGQVDACGGFSTSQIFNRDYKMLFSPKSIYAPIAYAGGGTTITALEKQLLNNGANLESEVPTQPLTEANLEDTSFETPSIIALARERAGYKSISIPTDIDSVASAIEAYGGVIIEITGQNNGSWLSTHPQPPIAGNGPTWNHFVFVKSAFLDNGIKTIGFINSWGQSVGNLGVQYLTQNYFDSGFIMDVIAFYKPVPSPVQQTVFPPTATTTPPIVKKTFLSTVLDWLLSLMGIN